MFDTCMNNYWILNLIEIPYYCKCTCKFSTLCCILRDSEIGKKKYGEAGLGTDGTDMNIDNTYILEDQVPHWYAI